MTDTALTEDDIRALPKVSLHDHLDGGLRPQTVLDLAHSGGIELPGGAPMDSAASLGTWFAQQADSGSLVDYLKTFDVTLSVMQSVEGLSRIAREFVEDLVLDGVVYGEIRWAPEQHCEKGLTLEQAVDAVQAGLDEAVSAAAAAGQTIQVGQLITAMRHNDRGMEIAKLAIAYRDKGCVGFDIAGAEAGFPPSRFADAFTHLAENMFPVTVHAGEADGVDSIRSALVDGRTLRLGHGVRIAEDIHDPSAADSEIAGLGEVSRWVLDRGIPLELSPSSNLQTGAVEQWGTEISHHPFNDLYRLGFAVTVNTDNRLMSSTTLTKELHLLVSAFGYGLEDLLLFQLNAAGGAFLRFEEREALVDQLVSAYTS